jgi:Ca2+-binding EF-hand superfamily protein
MSKREDAPQLSEQEISELRDAFLLFDQNGDGSITITELENVLKNLNMNPTKQELEDMLNEVDIDKNGTIDFDEFVALMGQKFQNRDTEEELQLAFKVFDKNNDGFISHSELKLMMHNLGENLSDEQIAEMVR